MNPYQKIQANWDIALIDIIFPPVGPIKLFDKKFLDISSNEKHMKPVFREDNSTYKNVTIKEDAGHGNTYMYLVFDFEIEIIKHNSTNDNIWKPRIEVFQLKYISFNS